MNTIAADYQYYQQSELMKVLAAAAHGAEYKGQTSSATYSEIKARLEAIALNPDSRILDAGCGNGTFSLALALDCQLLVDGIDVSRTLIDHAKQSAFQSGVDSRCRFFHGDFADHSVYPSELFDSVLCVGSLYWGQPLTRILDIWHRITRPEGQLILFLNLRYGPLTSEEHEAVGETQFFSALEIQQEFSRNGWALCEWSDVTDTYISWLHRWCCKMEQISPQITLEMGLERCYRLTRRFSAYLQMAKRNVVRRIIIGAEHVDV